MFGGVVVVFIVGMLVVFVFFRCGCCRCRYSVVRVVIVVHIGNR